MNGRGIVHQPPPSSTTTTGMPPTQQHRKSLPPPPATQQHSQARSSSRSPTPRTHSPGTQPSNHQHHGTSNGEAAAHAQKTRVQATTVTASASAPPSLATTRRPTPTLRVQIPNAAPTALSLALTDADDQRTNNASLGDLTPTSNTTPSPILNTEPDGADALSAGDNSPTSANSFSSLDSDSSSSIPLPPLNISPRLFDSLQQQIIDKTHRLNLANDHIQLQTQQIQHLHNKLTSYQELNETLLNAANNSAGGISGSSGSGTSSHEVQQLKALVNHLHIMINQRDEVIAEQEKELNYYQLLIRNDKAEKEREIEKEQEREKEREKDRERIRVLEMELMKLKEKSAFRSSLPSPLGASTVTSPTGKVTSKAAVVSMAAVSTAAAGVGVSAASVRVSDVEVVHPSRPVSGVFTSPAKTKTSRQNSIIADEEIIADESLVTR